MWAIARKCVPSELVQYPDRWRKPSWQTIHMILGMQVCSIPKCKLYHHHAICPQIFPAIGHWKIPFIQVDQSLKVMCKIQSLTLSMHTGSYFEDIITSSSEVFTDLQSHIMVGIWKVGNPPQEAPKSDFIVNYNTGLKILTLDFQAENVRSVRHCMHIGEVIYNNILMRLSV